MQKLHIRKLYESGIGSNRMNLNVWTHEGVVVIVGTEEGLTYSMCLEGPHSTKFICVMKQERNLCVQPCCCLLSYLASKIGIEASSSVEYSIEKPTPKPPKQS